MDLLQKDGDGDGDEDIKIDLLLVFFEFFMVIYMLKLSTPAPFFPLINPYLR